METSQAGREGNWEEKEGNFEAGREGNLEAEREGLRRGGKKTMKEGGGGGGGVGRKRLCSPIIFVLDIFEYAIF